MPLLDINNPAVIKFLIENYDKASRLRMRWNTIHAEKLNLAATFRNGEKGYTETDVDKAGIVTDLSSLTRDNKSGARNRRLKPIRDGLHIPVVANMLKGHSIVEVGLGDPSKDPRLEKPDTDLTIEPIMRPINPKQQKILYKSKPEFGRKVYLATRFKSAPPEDRYYFAETSSWAYGWRVNDSKSNRSAPQHGRVWHLAREKCRSGPQPDPIHYTGLARGQSKC